MITFNADEIFQMAEQIERNGAKFYRKAAEHADADTRNLLLTLAIMEGLHEKTFAAMRAELTPADRKSNVYDPDNQGALYLQAMADSKVFAADPSEALSGQESADEILRTAIDLEKDSIVFYQSMKAVVPAAAGLEKLSAIIDEEIGHIVTLTKQLEAI